MKFIKRYLFLLLLIISCAVVAVSCTVKDAIDNTTTTTESTTTTTVATTTTTTTTTTSTTTTTTDTTTTITTVTAQPTVSTTTITPVDGMTTTTAAPTTTTTTATTTAAPSAFEGCLFIGDSRTHGLSLYGRITGADFFAKTSLTSFSVQKESVSVKDVGTVTLAQLLGKKQYKKVYIMLGINEIGYNIDTVVGKYRSLLDTIKQTQPNATIILQATMHVAKKGEKPKSGITNERINQLNEKLKILADEMGATFVDLNPVYDDATGMTDPKYTNDGVHLYSKYYPLWRDYLAQNT